MEKYFVVFFPPAGEGPPRTYPLHGWFSSQVGAVDAARIQYPKECEEDSDFESWDVYIEEELARVHSEF